MIRVAAPGDVASLVALAAAAGQDVDVMRRRLHADLRRADRKLLVVVADGALAGYGRISQFIPPADAPANVAPAGYYLGGLLVAIELRRGGLGAALTRARLDWIFARAPEAWYFANARNQASLALHAALGFVEATRDFVYPGVTFQGGVGVLCRADRP